MSHEVLSPAAPSDQPPTVLWIEDKTDEITGTYRRLTEAGCTVRHVLSRRSAAESLEKQRFDGLVLDMRMADPDAHDDRSGEELFRALRDGCWGDWGREVPVIFFTGYAPLVEKHINGISPPPQQIIAKPAVPSSLAAAIADMIAEPRLRITTKGEWRSGEPSVLEVSLEIGSWYPRARGDTDGSFAQCLVSAPGAENGCSRRQITPGDAVQVELTPLTDSGLVEVQIIRRGSRFAYAVIEYGEEDSCG